MRGTPPVPSARTASSKVVCVEASAEGSGIACSTSSGSTLTGVPIVTPTCTGSGASGISKTGAGTEEIVAAERARRVGRGGGAALTGGAATGAGGVAASRAARRVRAVTGEAGTGITIVSESEASIRARIARRGPISSGFVGSGGAETAASRTESEVAKRRERRDSAGWGASKIKKKPSCRSFGG